MMMLIVGLLLLIGIHLLPTNPEIRDGLVARMGANGYKAFFSIVSLVGLIVVVFGYHKMQVHPGKNPIIWEPPLALRHLAFLLMLPSLILIVAANVPSRIRSAAKHPLLVGTMLWALAHLLVNGDLASIILFGSFLAYTVYDRMSATARGALGPLGARTAAGFRNDAIVLAIGLALYFALLYGGHTWLIGVDPLAGIKG